MFHRVDMHKMLMDDALSSEGQGIPVKLVVDHKCTAIDVESGWITFANGATAQHEAIIGADGVGVCFPSHFHFEFTEPSKSAVRNLIGVKVDKQPSTSTCLHANVATTDVHRLGLKDFGIERGIEYWGGQGIDKIVVSPCQDAQIISFYCFFPRAIANHGDEGWNYTATVEELLAPFPELDKEILDILKISTDIKPWRLFVHQPCRLGLRVTTTLLTSNRHALDEGRGMYNGRRSSSHDARSKSRRMPGNRRLRCIGPCIRKAELQRRRREGT
jgi:salicylate hydroxylase